MSDDIDQHDVASIVARGLLGAIPWVGPLLTEVIGKLIPDQREARLLALCERLAAHLRRFDQEKLSAVFSDLTFVDLLEDGFLQAVRALSPERVDYIASILSNGVDVEGLSRAHTKRLLGLLSEVSDVEMIMLASHLRDNQQDQAFFDRHEAILRPRTICIGSPRDDVDEAAIHESYRQNLARLGLLRPRFKKTARGQLPELDDATGMMKASGYDTTPLGRLLMRAVGVAGDDSC